MRALKQDIRASQKGKAHVEEAYLHILAREHNTESLGRALGVAIPTAARVVETLRRELAKKRKRLVSVRSGGTWHYEVRDDDREGRVARDRFVNLVVRSPKGRRGPGLKVEDRDIYEWD